MTIDLATKLRIESGLPYVQTWSGLHWFPTAPHPRDVSLIDIAHAHALICRFGGHCFGSYTVAQHSVLVMREAARNGASRLIQLQALLHDAHEAYPPGDVPSPVKASLPDAVKMEVAAADAVRTAFGVPTETHKPVRHADMVLLATERRDLMRASSVEWGTLPAPLEERIDVWSATDAEGRFLEVFDGLTKAKREVGRGS